MDEAADGEQALAALGRQRPDLGLLDVVMPGMDGFEVCRRLKASPDLADIPVIFLTANASDEARRAAAQLGAAGFLAKPYEPKSILDALETALNAPTVARRGRGASER